MEIAMSRSLISALLVVLTLATLAPVLGACVGNPGVAHGQSAVLPMEN
jgi:hypothetical protein